MNDKEVNDHINKLLNDEAETAGALEEMALQQFKQLTAEVAQSQQRLQQASAQVDSLSNSIVRLTGQREAYATILIKAETSRRGPKDGLTLVDLKDKMGVDRVQAVDNDGEVVADTDAEEMEDTENDAPAGK